MNVDMFILMDIRWQVFDISRIFYVMVLVPFDNEIHHHNPNKPTGALLLTWFNFDSSMDK